MFISVQELEIHRVTVSKSYDPGVLNYQGAEVRQQRPVQVDAVAELVGGEIRIRGRLTTEIEVPCDRCLTAVLLPVDKDFDLFYRPLAEFPREEEFEIPTAEMDLAFFSGDGIALADVASEQVLLAVPMKVLCRPDCRGLCPVCGADLNHAPCGCPISRPDSPFASLE